MSSCVERSSIKCFTPLWVFSSVYLCHRRILSDNPITTIEQEAFKTGFFDHFFLRMWVLLVTKVNIVFLVPSPMLFWCISLHALNVSRRWLQYYNHEIIIIIIIIIIINILVSWTYLRIYDTLMMQNVSNVFFSLVVVVSFETSWNLSHIKFIFHLFYTDICCGRSWRCWAWSISLD